MSACSVTRRAPSRHGRDARIYVPKYYSHVWNMYPPPASLRFRLRTSSSTTSAATTAVNSAAFTHLLVVFYRVDTRQQGFVE